MLTSFENYFCKECLAGTWWTVHEQVSKKTFVFLRILRRNRNLSQSFLKFWL
jgi:hypothetical protein